MTRPEGYFRVVDCPMKWEDGYELNILPSMLRDSLLYWKELVL